VDGSALTGAKGTWTGSEPSFSYQWLLCNSSGGSCKEISGATSTTLGLLTSMIGSTTRLVVTATNGAGSTSATSEPTSVIKALLPSNTALPSVNRPARRRPEPDGGERFLVGQRTELRLPVAAV